MKNKPNNSIGDTWKNPSTGNEKITVNEIEGENPDSVKVIEFDGEEKVTNYRIRYPPTE